MLHSFSGSDGANPVANLIMDTAGNLYGTTINGGANGGGTVFKVDSSQSETVLHSFAGSDGAGPFAGLIMDSSGNFYGTTQTGGSSSDGTVFELATTPQGGAQIIINQVNALLTQAIINNGQGNSLVKRLQHAVEMSNAGKTSGAIGNLESFIAEVNALFNSGVLTPSQAGALITAANGVIAQLI